MKIPYWKWVHSIFGVLVFKYDKKYWSVWCVERVQNFEVDPIFKDSTEENINKNSFFVAAFIRSHDIETNW